MKKSIRIVGLLALLALVIMQFIRPDKNESDYATAVAFFEKETQPNEEVKSILRNNCYDCHSNHTKYPWYAEIAPVSYWLSDHIDEGKEHFDVSGWEQYSNKKKDHKLEELVEEVEEGEMPLSSYTWLHGNINDQEKEILINWVNTLRTQYTAE
ncbi:heme-binding domain-containing protein [Aquimarina sp. AU119]|uniref:heme-binding domain-containing protein n=1 Tax=Aquimarina sp. AU119 TaxID=2108528 RepID=UPI000D68547C|nr:heme-binding domain-containing protein [Aquimarina sp. AU119]